MGHLVVRLTKIWKLESSNHSNEHPEAVQQSNDKPDLTLIKDPVEPIILIKTPKDLDDVLESLERFCYETDSANLARTFQMQKNFYSERIKAAVVKQNRLQPSTLDSYLTKQ